MATRGRSPIKVSKRWLLSMGKKLNVGITLSDFFVVYYYNLYFTPYPNTKGVADHKTDTIVREELSDILKNHFGEEVDSCLADLCRVLLIKRTDSPICKNCQSSRDRLSKTGSYIKMDGMTGVEYKCDDCGNIFDFDDFK